VQLPSTRSNAALSKAVIVALQFLHFNGVAGLAAVPTETLPAERDAESQFIVTAPTREATEGCRLQIEWQHGPDIVSVSAYARAFRTPVGKSSRGAQWINIVEGAPATPGSLVWIVPWIDSIRFRIFVKGYREDGQIAAIANIPLLFRPRELADETRDAIYVDLSNRSRQRLYRQKDGELVQVAICSGSSTNSMRASTRCGGRIHDHPGWFQIIQKDAGHVSTLNPEWRMHYGMRFHKAHFIHATSRSMYRRLGRPASHGCIRLHRTDAQKLYAKSRVGDWVKVY